MAIIPPNVHWYWFVAVIVALGLLTAIAASYNGILERVFRKDAD